MENKKMNVVTGIMIAAMGFMLFICMFIPMVTLVEENYLDYPEIYNDTAFGYLFFKTEIITEGYFMGLVVLSMLSWVQLIISISAMGIGLLAIFKEESLLDSWGKRIAILSMVAFGLYFTGGLVDFLITALTYKAVALTFIFFGLLLFVPFFILYLIFNKKRNAMAEVDAYTQTSAPNQMVAKNTNATTPVNVHSVADELLKWKGLLDQGVITQEEFDAKKKELLGL